MSEKTILQSLDEWKKLHSANYLKSKPWYYSAGEFHVAFDEDMYRINKYTNLDSQSTVVIIGSGYGREALGICQKAGTVYGVDVSNDVHNIAYEFLRSRHIYNFNGVLAENWLEAVPKQIDAIYSVNVFQHIPKDSTRKYFSQFLAKLKINPKGCVIAQFADLKDSMDDALIIESSPKEQSVRWTPMEIANLFESGGLAIKNFDANFTSPHGFWYWVHGIGKP